MAKSELDAQLLEEYARQLRREEKSAVTVEKYLRDVRHFERWLDGREITKERIIDYKHAQLAAHEPQQHLGGHEAALRAGKRKSGQGVPP